MNSLLRCWILGQIFTMTLLMSVVLRVDALSSPAPARQFIELTNPLKPGADFLPASFVSSWPTWVLDDDKELTKIPDSNGFLPPTSLQELWQPIDLEQPQLRLAVGLHVRDGVIRHVLPAVDLSFEETAHRNRGLCSVPRAYHWLDFQATGGDWCDYGLSMQTRAAESEEWTSIDSLSVGSIEPQVKAAIAALTEMPPEEIGDGSNVIHVVCDHTSIECPKPGTEFRVILVEDGFDAVVGTLQVKVEKTAAGSESEYLPDAYRDLFENESLRRKTYIEMKKRIEKRDQKINSNE